MLRPSRKFLRFRIWSQLSAEVLGTVENQPLMPLEPCNSAGKANRVKRFVWPKADKTVKSHPSKNEGWATRISHRWLSYFFSWLLSALLFWIESSSTSKIRVELGPISAPGARSP